MRNTSVIGWLLATPLSLILLVFLVAPILMIIVVSFWGATEWSIYPAFQFDNYEFLLTSDVTYRVFFNTFKYAAITWICTLLIGFTVAYYLAFHVRSQTWQTALFLLCTIPFLTSNIIRMISWIPFLGRNGIANSTLISMGVIDEPLEWLLFSDFSVILAFVHLYTLFMVVPIFNTMMRIDTSLIEAAADAGATGWQTLYDFVIVDTPPVLVVPDARVIAQNVDAVLFTVRWDKTSKTQVRDALRMFETVGVSVSGIVLNQIDGRGMKRYGFGDSYGAYSSYGKKYYNN